MDANIFNAIMEDIENELKRRDIPIFARPLEAIRLAAIRFKIEIPLLKNEQFDESKYNNYTIAEHIERWYSRKYGDLLKTDFSPASYIVLIRSDPFEMKLPRIFGKVSLKADRDLTKENKTFSTDKTNPPVFNILKGVKRLSQFLANQLTDIELMQIMHEFIRNHKSFMLLENKLKKFKFFNEGLVDYKESVKIIMENKTNYGFSKWESLQFIEKIIKGILDESKIEFKYTHDLVKLKTLLQEKVGINIDDKLIGLINCNPDVRYSSNIVSRMEAIIAHKSAVKVLSIITKEI